MEHLTGKLGFWQSYAMATGLVVAATTLFTLCSGVGIVGPAFIISSFIAFLIVLCVSFSYAELCTMIPGAGMVGDYTSVAMGRFMAMLSVLGGYAILGMFTGSAEVIVAGQALETVIPIHSLFGLETSTTTIFSIFTVILFFYINVTGADFTASVQVVLTVLMMLSLTAIGIIGNFGIAPLPATVDISNVPFSPAGMNGIFGGLALGIFLYIGIEYVCPMAEEIENPQKVIPKAMAWGLVTIFIVNAIFGYSIWHYVPLEVLATSESPQVEVGKAMFGEAGMWFMAFVSILAGVSSLNSQIAAIPRMLYGLARDGMMPAIFSYLHPKYKTPIVGLVLVLGVLFIPIAFRIPIDVLVLTATITWLFSYIIAQLDLIILRQFSHINRPYKSPFFPIPQIVGIMACSYMISNIHPNAAVAREIYGYAFLSTAIIVIYSVAWLKYKKLPLFTQVPLESVIKSLKHDD